MTDLIGRGELLLLALRVRAVISRRASGVDRLSRAEVAAGLGEAVSVVEITRSINSTYTSESDLLMEDIGARIQAPLRMS